MPYEDNKLGNVYGGERYGEAVAPGIRAPRMMEDVAGDFYSSGIRAMAANVGEFGNVLLGRYKNKVDNENQVALQEMQAEFDMDFKRRLALANGADGGFYDKNGEPDERKLGAYVDKFLARAATTNKGYVDPADAEARQQYLDAFAQSVREKTTAALYDSVPKRAAKAFDDSYRLYCESGDYRSAVASAENARQAGVISDDEYEYYKLRAQKSAAHRTLGGLAQAGTPEDMYAAIMSGKFDDYLTPEEKEAYLDAMQVQEQERMLDRIAGGAALDPKEAAVDPGLSFLYTRAALDVYNRRAAGEDVRELARERALDEVQSFFISDMNNPSRKEEWMKQWESLGMPKQELNEIWKKGEEVFARLETPSLNMQAVKQQAKTVVTSLNPDLQGRIDRTLYHVNDKGERKVNPSWEPGGENYEKYKDYAGIKDGDDGATAAAKYERKKREEIIERNLQDIYQEHEYWRTQTPEGRKANPAAQKMRLEDKISKMCGRRVTIADPRELQNTWVSQGVGQARRHQEWEQQRGGQRIDRPAPIGGRAKPEVNGDESLPAGILLPRSYEGQLDTERDGVSLTLPSGRCAVVPVVGFTDAPEPEVSYALAAKNGLTPQNMPVFRWDVDRGSKYAELRTKQTLKGGAKRVKDAEETIKNINKKVEKAEKANKKKKK